jgi:hypothetical protein
MGVENGGAHDFVVAWELVLPRENSGTPSVENEKIFQCEIK